MIKLFYWLKEELRNNNYENNYDINKKLTFNSF